MTENISSKLSKAFLKLIEKNYGENIAPPAYVTPFDIKPFDALLGGGLSSSLPVVFSSTPETGKSTIAFQFAGKFLLTDPNAIVVYIDTETASNSELLESSIVNDRINAMAIDVDRFNYIPIVADIPTVFKMMSEFIEMKKEFENKTKSEIKLCLIWDSMASTPSSKEMSSSDPKEVIGYRAREFSFQLSKIKPLLAINRVTLICIDQVRSNFKVDAYSRSEKTVGEFGNFKAATSVTSLQHNVKQWLFFSRSETIGLDHPYGIDGWLLNCYTEKNKIAPSNFWVTLVFDKLNGIDKVLTEYHFMKHFTKTELKYYKDKNKTPFELPVKSAGSYKYIEFKYDGQIYKTKNFRESELKKLYETDSEFRDMFDAAVEVSVNERIKNGYFKSLTSKIKPEPIDDYEEEDEIYSEEDVI